jgi:hypothetical protein
MRNVRNYLLTLVAFLVFLPGCATMLDIAGSACETALGGSKAAKVCDSIDRLKEKKEAEEAAEAASE